MSIANERAAHIENNGASSEIGQACGPLPDPVIALLVVELCAVHGAVPRRREDCLDKSVQELDASLEDGIDSFGNAEPIAFGRCKVDNDCAHMIGMLDIHVNVKKEESQILLADRSIIGILLGHDTKIRGQFRVESSHEKLRARVHGSDGRIGSRSLGWVARRTEGFDEGSGDVLTLLIGQNWTIDECSFDGVAQFLEPLTARHVKVLVRYTAKERGVETKLLDHADCFVIVDTLLLFQVLF